MSRQNFENERVRREKPANPTIALALAGVAVLLLLIIVIRFFVFSGTAGEYGAIQAEITQETAQTEQLESENAELQAEIDSMQGLIIEYNNSRK